MSRYAVAYRSTTTLYEIHKGGCRHIEMAQWGGTLDHIYTDTSDLTPAEYAAQYESDNEGCLTKIAPCAKK